MIRSARPNAEKKVYPASAYDQYLCLKPSLLLWGIVAFLLRPFVIFIASVTNKADRAGLLHLVYSEPHWALVQGIAATPAVLVAIAYMRRVPDAGNFVRWCWKYGRELILASLAFNVVTIALPSLSTSVRFTGLAAAEVGACALAAYYLFRSTRVADSFADFPSASPQATSR